jgi:hypothetical protein
MGRVRVVGQYGTNPSDFVILGLDPRIHAVTANI